METQLVRGGGPNLASKIGPPRPLVPNYRDKYSQQ